MARKGQCAFRVFQLLRTSLDFLIVFVCIGIQVGVPGQCGSIHLHRQVLQMANPCQFHRLSLAHLPHILSSLHLILGVDQCRPRILQHVGTLPGAPLAECRLQPLRPFGFGILTVTHALIARHGHLTSFRQVTIEGYQRVQLLNCQLSILNCQLLQCGQTSSLTVASLCIVVCQPRPFFQLTAYHAQQVMTKQVAVGALHHKRLIVIGLYCCQHLRMRLCSFRIQVDLLLPVVSQLMVLLVYLGQHSVIYRL